jgi:valine--pyruvate aminotransferase
MLPRKYTTDPGVRLRGGAKNTAIPLVHCTSLRIRGSLLPGRARQEILLIMNIKLSRFGAALGTGTGIGQLMADLGEALGGQSDLLMMGGGNPAYIPEVAALWRRRLEELAGDANLCDRALGNYDPPSGNQGFLEAVASLLQREFGWPVTSRNIAVTNGCQTAFFFLVNMLAGEFDDGTRRRVLLPIMPEYIGYADQGMGNGLFTSCKPLIDLRDDHRFKYRIDFDRLEVGEDIGAICVSRPNNPSGNVLTDEEVARLAERARQRGVPLLIDNAYGLPFPAAIYTDARLTWNEGMVLTFSLSKLGLPGTRTGIVVACEEIISALASINSVVGLASGNLGQAIVEPLIRSGELLEISQNLVRPFYERKAGQAVDWVRESFPDDLPYRVHLSEGAFFLWLWFPDLPITARELYERLRARKLLVVPGSHFFYGLDEDWQHSHECVRITYSQPDEVVRRGIEILAEEVQRAYGEG